MWHARPVSWLARRYAVEEGGRSIAEVEFGSWSERGAITSNGERLEVVREGFWNPRFHLERAQHRVAVAWRTGALQSAFTIAHGGEEYRLGPSSWLGRSHVLLRGGRTLGEIRPLGYFGRGLQIALDGELAPELSLFALWLVLLQRRRAAAAAAT
jgi:hypothetical protein